MVWYAWHGMVDMVWYGWYGIDWYGMAWYLQVASAGYPTKAVAGNYIIADQTAHS